MGRMTTLRPREATVKKKDINPIWRGVGCLLFLVLTVGAYFVADAAIVALNTANAQNRFLPGGLGRGIPRQSVELFNYKFPVPVREIAGIKLERPITNWSVGFDIVTLAFTLFLSILMFSFVALIWAALNPPKLGPKDAPPVRRKIKDAR